MTQHTNTASGAADLPEALRLANILDLLAMDMKTPRLAAAELRRQHAELESISAEPAPPSSICTDCSNADSWNIPDKPCCRTCTSGSNWEPLNRGSVNPNKALTAQSISAEPAGAGYAELSTPGEWFVRYNADKTDCFVAAPDCKGYAYDAEILGDDEYTTTNAEYDRGDLDAGIKRKTADCELIVAAVKAWRASHGQAPAGAEPSDAQIWAAREAWNQQTNEHEAMRAALIAAAPTQPAQAQAGAADANYHLIDRFLRNNLYDDDYAEYSAALDALASTPSPQAAQGAGITAVGGVMELVEQLVRAETAKTQTHEKYMGKAMPDDEYDRFAALRDERIPELRRRVQAALAAAPQPAPPADSQQAPQGETNVQLDTDPNTAAPGQQRDMAGSVALGQPVGKGSDQVAGHPSAQGDKLLTVAERNIRSFLRSATFKSESDREAALNCVDVLWEAARAADSVLEDAARYQWLRHGDNDEKVLCNGPVDKSYWYLLRNEKLDTAIDEARKQGGA